jgi:uncharacterized membrane protein
MKKVGLISILFIVCMLVFSGLSFAAKPAPTPDGTGTLTGKVLIAGTRTAIVGATVVAVGTNDSYSATTDSKGAYSMTPVAGDYNVTATADGYNNQTFSASVGSGTKTTVNFSLAEVVATGGTLIGTVIDATTGTPLSGALVATSSGGYSYLTDTQGEYSIDVAAGTYDLTASLDGYQSADQSATV